MRRLLLILAFVLPAAAQITISGTGNVTYDGVVQSGLIGQYRILPGEPASALVDYSGSGNTGVGTVGTAPTVASVTGGLSCNAAGAAILPSALNSALTYQVFFSKTAANATNVWDSPLIGNGNGSAGNVNGVFMNSTTNNAVSTNVVGGFHLAVTNGTASGQIYTGITWTGAGSFGTTMPGTDVFYLNGVATGAAGGNSAGLQTVGNYQLCGATGGHGYNVTSYMTGNVYYALFYNRALSAAEMAQNAAAVSNAMALRGVPTTQGNTAQGNTFVVTGDSIAQTLLNSSLSLTGGNWTIINNGYSGFTAKELNVNPAATFAAPYSPIGGNNVVFDNAMSNDNCATSATTVLGYLSGYFKAAKQAGYLTLATDMLSRTSEDTCKNSMNALIRQQWPTFADAFVDWASDPNLGADAASASTTYFNTGIHPTIFASNNDSGPMTSRAINRMFGNRNWTAATTYTTGAAAAVATTAITESSNTVTVTFSATPANCQAGNIITLAGITASGYNGNYQILTRSSTQVTVYNVSGLTSPATIQGTGVCSEQQDADVYTILAGSATSPSFTLETCQGYTGQNLYLKNENTTSPWVITPFQSSETIDGATSLTMPTASSGSYPVVILQSQLISASAAGCTWARLQ